MESYSAPTGLSSRAALGVVQGRLGPRYRNLYRCGMKTTLDIDDRLLADAKALAAQQRSSLTRLIEEGLRMRLRSAGRSRPPGEEVRRGVGVLLPKVKKRR